MLALDLDSSRRQVNATLEAMTTWQREMSKWSWRGNNPLALLGPVLSVEWVKKLATLRGGGVAIYLVDFALRRAYELVVLVIYGLVGGSTLAHLYHY